MTTLHVDTDLATLLNEALPLWAQVTQTPLGPQTQHSITLGASWLHDSYALRQVLADLNASRIADPSGWTTALLLCGAVDQLLDDATVRLRDVVSGDLPGLAEVTRLVQQVQGPVIQAAIDQVVAASHAAVTAFEVDPALADSILVDRQALGEVRLNALHSLDQLRIHQLCRGARTGRRLRLNTHVHQYPSVDHFAAALATSLDAGATLAVIYNDTDPDTRDRERDLAYFAFGVRDGDVLTIVTDLRDDPSPAFRERTRAPRRSQDTRARTSYLPYALLEPDAEASCVQIYGRPQWPIHTLQVHEVLWLLMVVEQLSDRIERGDFEQPELSYAGTLVALASQPAASPKAQSVLRTQRDPRALTMIRQQGQIALPTLHVATVTPEAAEVEPPIGHRAWLVERYTPRIPHGVVEVARPDCVRDAGNAVMATLPPPSGRRASDDDTADSSLVLPAHEPEVVSETQWRWRLASHGGSYASQRDHLVLRALPLHYLAHRADVARDAAWLARHNLAQVVQALAQDEFRRCRDTVVASYVAAASANPEVLAAVARQHWDLPAARYRGDLSSNDPRHETFPGLDELTWSTHNVLRTYTRVGRARYERRSDAQYSVQLRSGYRALMADTTQLRNADNDLLCKHCVDHHHRARPRKASTVTEICVDNYQAIARVMGIALADLPWALRHYVNSKPYIQNSTLRRVDPVDEIIDPWDKLDVRVVVALCRPCLNELRKAQDLPALPASPGREIGRLRRSKPALP